MDSYFASPAWKSWANHCLIVLLMLLLVGCGVSKKTVTDSRTEEITERLTDSQTKQNESNILHQLIKRDILDSIVIHYYDNDSLNKDPPREVKRVVITHRDNSVINNNQRSDLHTESVELTDTTSLIYNKVSKQVDKTHAGIKQGVIIGAVIIAIGLVIFIFIRFK